MMGDGQWVMGSGQWLRSSVAESIEGERFEPRRDAVPGRFFFLAWGLVSLAYPSVYMTHLVAGLETGLCYSPNLVSLKFPRSQWGLPYHVRLWPRQAISHGQFICTSTEFEDAYLYCLLPAPLSTAPRH
jgi:hypothetical protein